MEEPLPNLPAPSASDSLPNKVRWGRTLHIIR
jgi:hypothetical protein